MKGTDGVILVFDITKKETLDLLETWLKEIRDTNKGDVSKVLIGNKSDLSDQRQVSVEEANHLAEIMNCKYYEASAKTGQNVSEALDEIAKIAFNNYSNNEDRVNSLVLNKEEKDKKKKCC